jgi:hypothetical protein
MAKLTEPQKLFIVKALACYDTPTQVATAVREEFGIEVDRRQVQEYDPTKVNGRDISKKLRAVFEATRKEFLEQIADLPIANQAFRLRTLQRMVTKAESQGNMALVAQLLEQAAKEVGGALTNRRELTGKGGGPIQSESRRTQELSDDELLAIAAGGGP